MIINNNHNANTYNDISTNNNSNIDSNIDSNDNMSTNSNHSNHSNHSRRKHAVVPDPRAARLADDQIRREIRRRLMPSSFIRGSQGMGVVSNIGFDRVLLSISDDS